MSGEHAYDMQVPDLAAQVEQATTDFVEKSEHIAKCLQAKAVAEGSFADSGDVGSGNGGVTPYRRAPPEEEGG